MNAVQDEEYVTLQVHDAQLGRIEALIERNLARQEAIANDIKGEIKELHGEIKALDTKIDSIEKRLDAKIDNVEKRLEGKIDGLERKMDARFEHLEDMIAMTNSRIDDLNNKKSNNIALWAIATAVGICAFQAIVSLISLLK